MIRNLYKEQIYKEQKRQAGQGLFGFVLWIFIETGVGIAKEQIRKLTEGEPMTTLLTSLKTPAILSSMLVVPLLILELVNRRNLSEGFPVVVFSLLWLLPTVFIVTLMPIVRTVRAGTNLMANPVTLLLKVGLLVVTALLCGALLIDQMPCFLGVPNCD